MTAIRRCVTGKRQSSTANRADLAGVGRLFAVLLLMTGVVVFGIRFGFADGNTSDCRTGFIIAIAGIFILICIIGVIRRAGTRVF